MVHHHIDQLSAVGRVAQRHDQRTHETPAALAQLGRAEEAKKAVEVLLSGYPGFTVERHLRNFRWKNPPDIAHYREGLLKAGVPSTRLTLVESASKRKASS